MNEPLFTRYTNLAAEKLGASVPECSDDFFAEKENLIKEGRGVFIADKYTERGKWMDGWESRRKRTPGHDWCIVQLATPGKLAGVDIDTNHFLGNHPPFASIEAAYIDHDENQEAAAVDFNNCSWKEVLPKSPLEPGSQNFYAINDQEIYTHIKLHIYPDGGVARLKIYGEVYKNWSMVNGSELVNLAAASNGAQAILCNDMFFSHMNNLIMPGRGENMGDGWETKRNRTPHNKDWVIIRLAHKGTIEKILIDTAHFKGNYPDSGMLEGCSMGKDEEKNLTDHPVNWSVILPNHKLSADKEHFFEEAQLENKGPFTHVRLNIFPDGGVSRLRVWGKIRD
jgi:allantoicase